jgi:hypothetical protein
VQATNKQPQEVADVIITRRKQCMHMNAQVEKFRIQSIRSINNLRKIDEIESIVTSFDELLQTIKIK